MNFSKTTVDVLAIFSAGIISPKRVRLNTPEGEEFIFIISNIKSRKDEKLVGNPMKVFECEFLDKDRTRILTLKYELDTQRWYLISID